MQPVTDPFNEYKARPAVNASLIKDLLNGGYDVAYTRLVNPPEPTPAFKIGTLAHSLILENREDFVNAQDTNLRTKEGKYWKECQEKKGLQVIKPDTVRDLYGMRDAVETDDNAHNYLQACDLREQSFYGKINGTECKARIDALSMDGDTPALLCDLKTVASVDDFERDFYKYGYDLQADFYRILSGNQSAPFVFIVVEKTAPYRVRTYLRDINELANSEYLADIIKVAGKVVRDAEHNSRQFYSVSTSYLNSPQPTWILDKRENYLHQALSGLGLTL